MRGERPNDALVDFIQPNTNGRKREEPRKLQAGREQ